MKRAMATFLGFLASLAGVLLWIFLGFIGFIAGLAGAVMGILFYLVYNAVNPKDESPYRFIVAVIVMVVDILIAELLMMWAALSVSPAELFADSEYLYWFIIDIVIGLLLSGLCLGSYIAAEQRKIRMKKMAEEQNKQQPPYPYAQKPYGQNPYGQNPYAQNPYGQNPYGQNPYGQTPAGTQTGAADSPFPDFERKTAETTAETAETAAASAVQTTENIQPMPLKTRKITVRREKKFISCLVPVTLYCDGNVMGILKNGQTISFDASARQPHRLRLSWQVNGMFGADPEYSQEFCTDEGENDVFLRTEMHNGFLNITMDFSLVNDEEKKN